jgi:osmotically-inducible protein OsmY
VSRLLVALALASTAACGGGGAVTPPPSFESPAALRGAVTGYPAGVVPDDWIVSVIQRELKDDAVTRTEAIGATSDHGVVVLTGSVTTLFASQRALDIAHLVRGVRAIVDRIDLAAVPRPDNDLQIEAGTALRRDPVTARQKLQAHVEHGVALLTGEVDSPAIRTAALEDLQVIPGLVSVLDDVIVRNVTGPDALLAAAVRRSVSVDPWLDGSRVRVDAHRGVVRLDGWVTSPQERARAEADAWTASPAAVDVQALEVVPFADDGTLRGSPRTQRSDGDLQQSLLDAFLHDGRVTPFVPRVYVQGGVVVLSGVAPNAAVARAVDDDAWNLPGVRAVRDFVRALPATPSSRATSGSAGVARCRG